MKTTMEMMTMKNEDEIDMLVLALAMESDRAFRQVKIVSVVAIVLSFLLGMNVNAMWFC